MTATIGASLKDARTKKSVSLDDVHAKIKIHPRVLQLLEEDKFDKLPSPLFAKSFLKSYADFLELNTDSLLEIYDREKQKEPDQVLFLRPADPTAKHKANAKIETRRIAGIVLAILALVLFLSGIPQKTIGAWAMKMKPAKSATTKAIKKEKEKKDEAALLPKVQPEAESRGEAEWLNSVKLKNFPQIAKKTPLDLEIRALDAVWVHVTGDGAILFQGILKKGVSGKYTAKDMIEVWTGNAANMSLSLNKTSLGSPGKGFVKKMQISRDGIRVAASNNN